eukprot:scaffold48815_cov69-Phaeocystis_antarctica.AAC.4
MEVLYVSSRSLIAESAELQVDPLFALHLLELGEEVLRRAARVGERLQVGGELLPHDEGVGLALGVRQARAVRLADLVELRGRHA